MNSEFLKLKKSDFWKGLIVAVLTAGFTAVSSAVASANDFSSFNWQSVALASLGGFSAYIVKNLLTNSDGDTLKKDKK
jgi:hypothetical protein